MIKEQEYENTFNYSNMLVNKQYEKNWIITSEKEGVRE